MCSAREHGARAAVACARRGSREEPTQRRRFARRRVLVDGMRAHPLDEADALDQLPQLRGRHRRDDVRAEHLARQRDVHLEHVHAERGRREPGIDRAE